MKLILATPSIDSRHGGIARSTPGLAKAVAAEGTQTDLIYPDYGGHSTINGTYPNLTLRPLPDTNALSPLRNGKGLRQTLKAALDGAKEETIIHQSGIWTRFNHQVALFAARNQIPLVCSPRGMLDPWSLQYHSIRKKLAWGLYAKRDLNRVSLFHATSKMEANHIRDLGFTQPIAILPNGIDLPSPIPRPQLTALPGRKRLALFLSRISRKKGLSRLIKAWSEVQPANWELHIAGPDNEGYRRHIETLVKESNLADTIHFLGDIADQDKWDLYQSADLFVLPTETENFGIVIAEALAMGLPVLTTQGAPWKVIEEDQSGFWVYNSYEGIKEGLRQATSTADDQLKEMGKRGRERIQNDFQWNKIGSKMRTAYHWLLGEADKPDWVHS